MCRPAAGARTLAAVAAVLALAALAAGCGGGPGAPRVAALGTTGSTTTTPTPGGTAPPADGGSGSSLKMAGGRAFSACMRSHGVHNFPDPDAQGGLTIDSTSGIDPSSPQFQAAQRACQKLLPGGGRPPSPAEQAKMQAWALRFSACMRSHGVPNFPDPTFRGGAVEIKIDARSGVDPRSPTFRAAQQACQADLPGLRGTGGAVGKAAASSDTAPAP
jgi:hypothetical protein